MNNADVALLNKRILEPTTSTTQSAEADQPVGPGDLIEISVFEVEELSKLKVRVPLTGMIALPLLGQIPAAGRTGLQLEDDIRALLQQKYMHDPQVSVFVQEHNSQRISIFGAVSRGGVYPLSGRLRLADALALAGGVSGDADHFLYLMRNAPSAPGGKPAEATTTVIDLDELAKGRDEYNIPLEAGDVIEVPRASTYYVGGSVEHPGSFVLKASTTVDQAIVSAGGMKDTAAWGDIRIYRDKPGGDSEVLTFDLDAIEKGGPKPEIKKNDVVIVGKSQTKAFLYGFLDLAKSLLLGAALRGL